MTSVIIGKIGLKQLTQDEDKFALYGIKSDSL